MSQFLVTQVNKQQVNAKDSFIVTLRLFLLNCSVNFADINNALLISSASFLTVVSDKCSKLWIAFTFGFSFYRCFIGNDSFL